jgi:integrase
MANGNAIDFSKYASGGPIDFTKYAGAPSTSSVPPVLAAAASPSVQPKAPLFGNIESIGPAPQSSWLNDLESDIRYGTGTTLPGRILGKEGFNIGSLHIPGLGATGVNRLKRARHKQGSVVYDKRRKVWNYLYCENGARRTKLIGSLRDFPTKAAAWRAADEFRASLQMQSSNSPTVKTLVEQYRTEKMSQRLSTRLGYDAWLNNHIVPRWGDSPLSDMQARPVDLWLQSLSLSPKSKVHIRGLLHSLWDYAMWRSDVPTQRNPMELVTIRGATKRTRKPRSLTVEEFQRFLQPLEEPFRTIALVCVCFGLRISECLALKWSDVDWLNGKLRVERGIVRQQVDDVKTIHSQKQMSIDRELLVTLKAWRQATQFSAAEDWMFASPVQLGGLPWSYPWIWRVFQRAASQAGIGKLGTHTMRHSYRAWLDAVGTSIAVQQKLMRHTDIRTTMNVYGDVVTDEMAQAHSKVVGLALSKQLN